MTELGLVGTKGWIILLLCLLHTNQKAELRDRGAFLTISRQDCANRASAAIENSLKKVFTTSVPILTFLVYVKTKQDLTSLVHVWLKRSKIKGDEIFRQTPVISGF